MKLYTASWQNRPLVCLESQPGWLTPLPYETMNHLLMDAPDHRDQVLARAAKGRGEFSLGDVTVLAPIPHPRQDVICLGMNYRAHKAEAEQFDPAAFTRQGQAVYFSKRATACPGPGAPSPATSTWWTAWTMRPSWRWSWAGTPRTWRRPTPSTTSLGTPSSTTSPPGTSRRAQAVVLRQGAGRFTPMGPAW